MDVRASSAQSPELPTVELSLPAGWRQESVSRPDVLVAAVSDGPQEAFLANVVISAARHEAPVELDAVADGVRRRLLELPRVQLVDEKPVTVDALAGHLFRVAYAHPTAGGLVQAVLVVPVQRGPEVHVLEVVGTASAARIAEDVPVLDSVMRSLRVA